MEVNWVAASIIVPLLCIIFFGLGLMCRPGRIQSRDRKVETPWVWRDEHIRLSTILANERKRHNRNIGRYQRIIEELRSRIPAAPNK